MARRVPVRPSRRPNALAICISLMAVGILYAANNPETAGANPGEFGLSSSIGLTIAPTLRPSMMAEGAETKPGAAADVDAATDKNRPSVTGKMALLMHILMLEKARDRVAGFSGYSVKFHKHERIGGSLQQKQSIAMDIRHKPFSVYMKWQTGDRGRQLLFKPEEQDGKALVKLGGLKGRLLPAVRIEPDGSKAMSESRYPITKAGILNMIDTILAHRRDDLNKRNGLVCEMYENQVINDTNCFGFVIKYPSQEVSALYRWSVVYLNAETLVPTRVCNYTWAKDADELSPEELDAQTLIEDYAYTNLQVREQQTCSEMFNRRKL